MEWVRVVTNVLWEDRTHQHFHFLRVNVSGLTSISLHTNPMKQLAEEEKRSDAKVTKMNNLWLSGTKFVKTRGLQDERGSAMSGWKCRIIVPETQNYHILRDNCHIILWLPKSWGLAGGHLLLFNRHSSFTFYFGETGFMRKKEATRR